jgi:hypothetical protein
MVAAVLVAHTFIVARKPGACDADIPEDHFGKRAINAEELG